jgi:hypothetical protein
MRTVLSFGHRMHACFSHVNLVIHTTNKKVVREYAKSARQRPRRRLFSINMYQALQQKVTWNRRPARGRNKH